MIRITSLLVLVMLCGCCVLGKEMTEIEVLSSNPRRCTYEHAFDMYGAYCVGLRLTKLPNLRGGIEILDFSDNKLRELHEDTFSGYTSIKFLYLADNQIYSIDDNALSSFSYLETLDLSKNVIRELPNSIFQLTSLRKLDLSGNPLNLNYLTITTPIKAPLELLDLSDCKIRTLPDWGVLPQLIFYNISYNPLLSLEVKQFAQMCNLRKIDMTESISIMKVCDIKPVITWYDEKRVAFQLDLNGYAKLNSEEFQLCQEEKGDVLNATYHRCKAKPLQVQNTKSSRRTWLTIGGGLAGFLVGFILLLYVMHRHNVAQTRNAEKKKTAAHNGDKNAAEILLDDVS